jgi:hypothetical protein
MIVKWRMFSWGNQLEGGKKERSEEMNMIKEYHIYIYENSIMKFT